MKSLLTSFLILLLAFQADGAITRVRSTFATTSATNAQTVTLDFNGANATNGGTPSAGNTLVIVVAAHLTSSVIIRASDQTGITWMGYPTPNNPCIMIITGRVFSTIASAQVTINQTVSGTLTAIGAEYSGTNIRVDKQKAVNGSSAAATTGTTDTTTNANELWIGGLSIRGTGVNSLTLPTNGFSFITCAGANQTSTTIGTSNADVTCGFLEKIVTSTGTASTGVTNTNNAWNTEILTLEETPTGSGQRSWIGWIRFFNWLKSGGLIKR